MKVIYFILIAILISLSCFSQLSHVEILLGKKEQFVKDYLDSLNKLSSNKNATTKKDTDENGDLILKTEFPLDEEEYFTCYEIRTYFTRVNGIELCSGQMIIGFTKYAQSNLSFVKDNFKSISENYWEKPFGKNEKFKIGATFKREGGEYPVYMILYDLVKAD